MRGAAIPLLVVEDSAMMRQCLQELLSWEGYAVRLAADGAAGVLALQQGPTPACILLDWHMPHGGGLVFRQAQLATPRWRNIATILLTGDAPLAAAHPANKGTHMLAKPIDLRTLLSAVAAAVRPTRPLCSAKRPADPAAQTLAHPAGAPT